MKVVCSSKSDDDGVSAADANIVAGSPPPPIIVGASIVISVGSGRVRAVDDLPGGGVSTPVATPVPHAEQRPALSGICLPHREQIMALRVQTELSRGAQLG